MTLFDTPEVNMFGSPGHTPPSVFKGDKAILLVYSITDLESFLSLSSWLNEVNSRSRGSEPLVGLIGNKVDQSRSQRRTVTTQQVKEFAGQNFISEDLIFEVSAIDGTNIQHMFDTVARKIYPVTHSKNNVGNVKISTTSKSRCC